MTHFTNLTNLTRSFISLTLVDHAKTKHSSSLTRLWKYLTALVMVLCLGVGNAWGADFTPANIVASGGTTADHVKVSTVFSTQTNKPFCSSETGLTGVNINNSASQNWNTYYVEIQASSGYTISSLSLKVASSGTSDATEAVAFWSGEASGTCSSYGTFTAPAYDNSTCANQTIDVPAGTRTIRIYRKICISKSDYKTFASSNKVDVGGSTTYLLFGITATAAASGGGTTYSVMYNGSGAGGGTVPTDGNSYASGATVTVKGNTGSLTKSMDSNAATFLGWNTNSDTYSGTHYNAGATFSMPASNTTLYAVWGYALSYNTDGGTINDDPYPSYYVSIYPDDDPTTVLPTDVTKPGYDFDGWKTGNGSGSIVTAIDGDYTGAFSGDYALKAIWTAKEYTVTLNNQSATSAGTESVTTTYNATTNLTSAITCPTKTSKVFAGYFTGTNGTGVQLIDPAGNWIASAGGNSTYMDGSKNWKYDGDLTLYACWMEYANSLDLQNYVETEVGSSAGDKTTSKTFTYLTSNNYICSLSGNTELDNSDDAAYRGLKLKNSGDYILFLVPANNTLSIKWGYVKSSKPKYSINGGAAQTFSTLSTSADNSSSPGEIEISSQSYVQLVRIWSTDGNAAVLKKVTITSACSDLDAPTGLECVDQSYNTMSFSWNAVTNASSYDVKLWTNSSCTGDPVKSANTTNTTCRIRDLSSSTTYYCKVQTKGDGSTYCTSGGTTATAASGTTLSSTRTFKSGETVFFKDASSNIGTINRLWVIDGGNVYAYFYNSNDDKNWASGAGAVVRESHHYGNAIYSFTVPKTSSGEDHEWSYVIFTRGTAATWGDGFWNQTQQQGNVPQDENMFTISTNNPDGSGYYSGSWSTYANGAAVVGDMNNWRPDGGEFNYSGSIGTVYMDLAANTEYKFKVLDGTGWKGCGGTITNTTVDWWGFNTDEDCTVRTGEAGNYAFKWNNGDNPKRLGIYYPQARLKQGEYIYFDARDNSTWTAANFDARFWFKYYDSDANHPNDVTYHDCAKANALDNWVYPYEVPNSDYIGHVQVNRMVSGSQNGVANDLFARDRASSKPNCIKLNSGDNTTSWTTYCPPMSSATLSDNGTTKTAIGSGTEGSPYIVVTGTTIKVSAEAESAVDDDNMTAKFNFKVGGSSQQNSTTTTYTHEASTNNTVYAMSVSAYNNYNSTDGTAANSNVIYYKALDSYTISYSAGGEDGVTGSHDSDTKYYGIDLTLPGVVFSKTGYTQTGWATSKGGDKAYNLSITNYSGNADATLYPVWTANPISVTLAKGDHGAANQSATINYDATTYASFTAVSGNTGYRCTGYYDGETQVLDKDGAFAADNVTGYITSGKWTKATDCTLTAHWEGIPYSITYKDEDDETFSGTHETGYPTSHTYGSATALKKATKDNYAFAGWYTTSGCTGDAITSIGATAYSSNITLYARWVELDLHEPCVYEKPEDLDGYGRPLKNNSSHDYEVYWMSLADSKGALYAGSKNAVNDGYAMFTTGAASTEIKGDGWMAFNTTYAGSEARIGSAASGTEFFIADGNNENGAKDSRYAAIDNSSYIRLRVSGYDEFAFYGSVYDPAVGRYPDEIFTVKLNGVSQTLDTRSDNNLYVYRLELDEDKEYFIEVSGLTTSSHFHRFRAFSLRLPDVTRYTVSAEENNDSYGAVDVTSISNVRTGSTLYVDDNTFTVNGTTVTATPESGYRFDNWTIGGVEVSTTATISAATTVTANFAELYTLSYDANGGTGTMSDKVGDGTVTLDANTFTKTGYIFAGWATSQANANAGTIAYADEASYTFSDDATLYAVWYKVIYEFTPATSGDAPAIDATISSSTGGKMTYTPTDSKTTGAIVYDAKGLKFTTTGNCAVTVDLDVDMDGGDVIVATLISTKSGDNRGLKLATTASTDAVQSWKWNPAGADEERTYKYTITESGTFDGADEFRIIRITDAYLTTLKVARFVADFELTWNFNGGGSTETEGDDYTASGSVESGTTLDYPANSSMSKPGYKFNGWSSTPTTMPASNLTLTAQWTSFDLPNVSNLDVDAGATLSSIPLSWTIPGICDLKNVEEPIFTPDTHEDGTGEYGTLTNSNYTGDGDFITAVGTMPQYGQFGVGFDIPATTNIEWISFDHKGTLASGDHLWGGVCDASHAYWHFEDPMTLNTTSTWSNTGELNLNCVYWGPYESKKVSNPITVSVSQVAIYANTAISGGSSGTFYVRNVRYHVSGQNDIDHIVLMRKEGSAATGPADASATKLYEGTKSHYTDASDVTGKNYYYTVFAVHANGAVSTGVSTSLTLYTITYNAGANGTGTVPDGKKTSGIDFTLSSSTFTRDGFTQDGWSTSDGGDKIYELGETYSTDAALTLYPHWVAVSGPVITNGNPANGSIAVTSDGSTPILSAVTGSTVYIAATPSTGYSFTSWDVYKTDDASTKVSLAAATPSTTFEMPSYAVTVNASFTAKTYTVTLNGNGGSGNTANVTATYNSSTLSSSITNPTKTGYIFDGWYSGSGGTGSLVIDDNGVLQANVAGYTGADGIWTKDATTTLYAKWSRDVKTASWGAPWGGTAIPNATTSTVNSVTLNACNSAKGTLWTKESYTMGNGDSVTINLASGYYISAISTAALFDEYGGNTNKLYIQFNSESTYSDPKYDLNDPITLGDDCYDAWGNLGNATPVSVSPIPSGAQSAKIYCEGNSDSGNYLYRIIVEITAYDCTPSTVSFDGGDATLGSAPADRDVCGSFTLPGSGSLVYPGYLFSKWNDGEDDYDIGDSYDVTGDVTFTAQWVEDNTSLRIPGSVVTLNRTNDARTTGSDDSTIDIDGDGNLDDGISLAGNKYVEWDVYITPGVYNVKSTLCVPSWGIEATVTLIDPAGVDDDVVLLSTGHSSGEQDVYKRYSVTKKCDFTGLVANKRYIVRAEDLWAGGSSKPRVKDVVFTPLYDVTITADPDGYGEVDESSLDDVASGTVISASSNVLTIGATEITAIATDATAEYTYSFSNWTKGDGTALPASVTSDLSVRANFNRTANNYTLTWDFDGGSTSDDDYTTGSVAYGTTLDYPASNTMSKSGYDFAGWSTDASMMPAEALTITAQWAERFTVTYNAMTGSVDPSSATGSTASKVTLPEPTKAGYDFLGWYNTDGTRVGGAGDKYGPTEAITLYAKWQGSCSASGSFTYDFEASDYLATYFDVELGGNAVAANHTYEVAAANADKSGIKVSDLTGGGEKMLTGSIKNSSGTTITYTTKASYAAIDSITFYENANDATGLYVFKVINGSGEAIYTSSTLSHSGSNNTWSTKRKVDLSASPKTGKVQLYVPSTASGKSYGVDNIKIYYGSSIPCYTVTYHGNGATSGYVNDPAQYAAGSSVSAKYNSALGGFERTGYEFVEWNTAADGSGDAYKPFARITSSIDDDINLYAQWRIVIDADNTDFADKDDPTQYRDVKVTNGATLTLTQNTAVRDIIVETGSTLNVSTNGGSAITLATRSLSLVGGLATIGGKEKYDMPRVFVNSASKITKTEKTINFDIAVDNRNFYPIAVPFPVTVSDVDYVDATLKYYSNYGTAGQYVIKTYDGQKRANADMSNCWRVMRDGVKHYETSSGEASEVMVPGRGYILRALPASGYGDYAVIRFPMKNVDDEWTNGGEKGSITVEVDEKEVTTTKNAVSVVAYTNNSGGDTKTSNKGWNILGVPYMSCFVSSEMDADPSDAYLKGLLNITTGEYKEGDANIYVTIPKYDFSEYDQLNITEAKLSPGWCFFIQMDKDATLAFDKVGERASAPFRATTYEHMPTVKTGIILSSETASDKTTFLISDKYSAAEYEINADLEKMFGENSYTLATYSLSGDTRLAYNAMSRTDATNVIPIGYRAPAEGEYTFAINPRYAESGDFERIDLIDYETGFVTNLLQSSYTFTSDRTQSDSRFALNVVPQKETPTDIDNGDRTNGEGTNGARKVIIDNKLYIILNGKMYDAKGVMVK